MSCDGSGWVVLGYKARIGATLLLIFLVLATYFFHNIWALPDGPEKQQQTIQFMREFWQLDMFGRDVVTRKVLLGNWAPAGHKEAERSGPFAARRGRAKR